MENKRVVRDVGLQIEAYRFQGIVQPFPNHFHEYYVIGLVEEGQRRMTCKNREYTIQRGTIVLLNPGDNHGCVQTGSGTWDYRGLNISKAVMAPLAEEVTGRRELPGFSQCVIADQEAACCLRLLHEGILTGCCEFEREEQLLLLLSLLLQRYGRPFASCVPECRAEIEKACTFMEQHFDQRICLDQICHCAGLSRSTLLRAFTKEKGVTPYNYLESVRVGKAKTLLEQGVPPMEAALRTGFSDQSHFTNYFSRYIGLPPGAYREMFAGKKEETTYGA